MCCDSRLGLDKEQLKVQKKLKFKPASSVGEYSCDLPLQSVQSFIGKIKEKHGDSISYIFLTGDYPGHDTWNQTRKEVLQSTIEVLEAINQTFPGVPVFPTVGNHESFPVNMFPDSHQPGEFNPKWLYQRLAEMFHTWLPGTEQYETILDGGYYSVSC